MQKIAAEHSQGAIDEAITYCLERKHYSAVDCRDAALWFSQQASDNHNQAIAATSDIRRLKVKAEKRNIAAAYAHLAGGEA